MAWSFSNLVFRTIHRLNLVYNTCWEDPRIDREALELSSKDDVLVITSAGCNALDYLLAGANSVTCVDVNPIQNALLELKVAAAQSLSHPEFFCMFGEGNLPGAAQRYRALIRPLLKPQARSYWDKRISFFDSDRSFYFRGTSGLFARMIGKYIDKRPALRSAVNDLTTERDATERRAIYQQRVKPLLWSAPLKWLLGRNTTLALLGVPPAQRRHLEHHFGGSIVSFMERVLEEVFVDLPFTDNYFYRVYLDGRYTSDCCPEYLKAENFERLRTLTAKRLTIVTNTVVGFLEESTKLYSRFILLDHMDWLSRSQIATEWRAILAHATPDCRMLWRSGAPCADFFLPLQLDDSANSKRICDVVELDRERADRLHPLDRVHTYGSFGIANLRKAA